MVPGGKILVRKKQEAMMSGLSSRKLWKHPLILILSISFLVLAACGPAQNPLDATSWRLVSMRNENGDLSPSLPGSVVTLNFQATQAAGMAGCNEYSGTYTVDGDALKFGPLSTTRQACPDLQVMQQEQVYMAALEKVQNFKMTQDSLELLDGSRNTLLVFGLP
jgi:heat shock protein HslJ